MYAESFVGSVRSIEADAECLLERRSLLGQPETDRRARSIRRATTDVTRLLSAAVPIPSVGVDLASEGRDGEEDDLVVEVLRAGYEHGVASVATADEEVIAEARKSSRVVVVADRAFVPLERAGPYAANWPTTIEFLAEVLANARTGVGRVRQRLLADGANPAGRYAVEWRSIERRLASLAILFAAAGTERRDVDAARRTAERSTAAGRTVTDLFTEEDRCSI